MSDESDKDPDGPGSEGYPLARDVCNGLKEILSKFSDEVYRVSREVEDSLWGFEEAGLGFYGHVGGGCTHCGAGVSDGCCDEYSFDDCDIVPLLTQDPRYTPRRITVKCTYCKEPQTFELVFKKVT